jgi:hypothetical protein
MNPLNLHNHEYQLLRMQLDERLARAATNRQWLRGQPPPAARLATSARDAVGAAIVRVGCAVSASGCRPAAPSASFGPVS